MIEEHRYTDNLNNGRHGEGRTEMWSGQGPEFFESLAVTWGKFVCLDDNTSRKRRFDVASSWFNIDSDYEESWSNCNELEIQREEDDWDADLEPPVGKEGEEGENRELSQTNKWSTTTPHNEVEFEFEEEGCDVRGYKLVDSFPYSRLGEEELVEVVADSFDMFLRASDLGGRIEGRFYENRPQKEMTTDLIESSTGNDLGLQDEPTSEAPCQAHKGWLTKWSEARQWGLSKTVSDHCPILLRHKHVDWEPKPFKFFDAWLQQEGCKELIKEVWGTTNIQGWAGFRLKEKLKLTKEALKRWSKTLLPDIDNKISKAIAEIAQIDMKGEEEKLSKEEIIRRREDFLLIWESMKSKETNRLKEVLDGIVGEQQMAFISGRQLMDGVVVANEVIDEVKKKKKKTFMFKINFENAYDKVSWKFLNYMMQRMGFCGIRRNWTMECLRTSLVSVLVNGSPTRQFTMTRGHRSVKIKTIGWFGVERYEKVQHSPIRKMVGRIVMAEKGLWKRVICEKYGREGEPSFNWLRESINYSSTWWRDLSRLNEIDEENRGWLMDGLELKVGERVDISFWWDKWCVDGCLANKYPRLYLLSVGKDNKISQMGVGTTTLESGIYNGDGTCLAGKNIKN
ncbi:hypothetical protein SLEP1_g42760 [Rubroshorea leprosula]|uniref:Reverse transcriptase domain-containing protein n=1 Tax=Rubroshorea leprosula TaxID=152421 RepID=A0AAV5LAY1_9ROSI|nr:hypothetical protein SLEP1_g42760 [Rubroshorea leprosula]